jgi:hypothetical protein
MLRGDDLNLSGPVVRGDISNSRFTYLLQVDPIFGFAYGWISDTLPCRKFLIYESKWYAFRFGFGVNGWQRSFGTR